MVGDVNTDREPPADAGRRGSSHSRFLKVLNQSFVQAVQACFADSRVAITKTHDVQAHRYKNLEFRLRSDPFGQISGLRTVLRDQLSKPTGAVLFQRKPNLQRAKAAGQLRPEVTWPIFAAR